MEIIEKRRVSTLAAISSLQEKLERARTITGGVASVFATGSYGRLEAGDHSDLDLCIVALLDKSSRRSKLKQLDEILLKAKLIDVTKEAGLPKFDGDGKYLGQFTAHDLISEIGSTTDDSSNSFTTRMLMMLEGKPVVESDVFNSIRKQIIDAYWVDYKGHEDHFIPSYLTNDILRLWRTFCINYEARTRGLSGSQLIKKKVKNYKLKHSRILTCYSAILYLLGIYKIYGSVSPEQCDAMCSLTPTERLVWLTDQDKLSEHRGLINDLLLRYASFLDKTNKESKEIEQEVKDNKNYTRDDHKFGEGMFLAINGIGGGSKFHRMIVV